MKQLPNSISSARPRGRGQQARVQTVLLLAIFFLLGIAVSAFWFRTTSKPGPVPGYGETVTEPAAGLSESTRAVLRRLNSPLEIHYYTLLDSSTVPSSLVAFAGRLNQLLAIYEQAGGGQVKLTRINALSLANISAAEADGLDAFNRDIGEPCYLGVALLLKGKKEALPRLSSDWEPALESDLTRAIARLIEATQPAPAPAAAPQPINTNAAQEVRTLIPDLNTVSLEEGKRIIQEASLKEFRAATKEMQTQIKEAEQRLSQVQAGGSETDRQAAVKHLQRIQAEQTEKLKEIAARAKAQAEALERLKSGS